MDQIAVHLPGMLLAWTAFFITAASPGPANLANKGTSMIAGRKADLAQACGTAFVSFSSDTVTRVYSKFHHWFEITFGIMFAAAGLKLLSSVKQS